MVLDASRSDTRVFSLNKGHEDETGNPKRHWRDSKIWKRNGSGLTENSNIKKKYNRDCIAWTPQWVEQKSAAKDVKNIDEGSQQIA
jgi:hypothetical protein